MTYNTLATKKNTANYRNFDADQTVESINRAVEYFGPIVEADIAKNEVENAKQLKIENRANEKFSTLIIRLARKQKITGIITFDPEEFSLSFFKNRQTVRLALSNLQKLQREIGKNDFESAVRYYLHATMESFGPLSAPPSFDDIKGRLVPLVRNRFLTDNACWVKDDPDAEDEIGARILSDDAVILLGLDGEKTTAIVSQKNLKHWGISYVDAMKEAMKCLRNHTPCTFKQIAPGVFRGTWIDDYDSSRILLPEVIESASVDGTPVFMMPTRNCFLVTAQENVAGQRAMVDIAKSVIMKERKSVSTNMYKFQDGTAVEFTSDDAETIEELSNIKHIVHSDDYAQQRKLIQDFNLKNSIDVFVAEYFLIETKQSGEILSSCALTEGICQLLPKTEVIALFMPNASPGEFSPRPKFVKWADIAEILGCTVERLDGYPTRYRVSGYPTPEQFDALTSV